MEYTSFPEDLEFSSREKGVRDTFRAKIEIENIVSDHGGHNITIRSFNNQLKKLGWFDDDMPVYCDPAGGERIQEITWRPEGQQQCGPWN